MLIAITAHSQTKENSSFNQSSKQVFAKEKSNVSSTTSGTQLVNKIQNTTSINDLPDVKVFPGASMQATCNVSVDKTNTNHLFATAETYANSTFSNGYYYSNDAGLTWQGSNVRTNATAAFTSNCAWPRNVIGSNGTTYFGGNGAQNLSFQKSVNGGASWGTEILAYGNIIEDPNSSDIATDNVSTSPNVNNFYSVSALRDFNSGFNTKIVFNRSVNNGASFSSAIVLKSGFAGGPDVETGVNGEVYVCWADRDLQQPTTSTGLGFCKSLNGGVSFSPYQRPLSYTGVRVGTNGINPTMNNTIVNDYPSMAVDKSNGANRGRIYVAFAVKAPNNTSSIIKVSYSDNQGANWSTPAQLTQIGPQNWHPTITVDDFTGEVWVAFYAQSSNNETATLVSHSTNGGIGWNTNFVSDVYHVTAPINNNLFTPGYAGFYIGVAAYNGKATVMWSDNRDGNWQLYSSGVTVPSINGVDQMCANSTATYNIINSTSPSATYAWSSNSAQLTVTGSGAAATVTSNGVPGNYTITCVISSGGLATPYIIRKNIQVVAGAPSLNSINASWIQNGATLPLGNCNQITDIFVYGGPGTGSGGGEEAIANGFMTNPSASIITWSILGGCGYPITFSNNGNSFHLSIKNFTGSNNNNTYAILRCTLSNSCGSVYKDYAFYTYSPICTLQPPCAGGTITSQRNSVTSSINLNVAKLLIFPNPSSGSFVVNLSANDNGAGIKEIIITNKMGTQIFKQKYSDSQKSKNINLFNQPLDTYIVNVFDGKNWYSEKVIITK